MYIYVLDKDGKPLMPTRRAGKVRRMLVDGMATVVRRTPFTIRLAYDTPHYVHPLTVGQDAGAQHVGVSVSSEKREYYVAQVDLRTDIQEKLAMRRQYRRDRRSRKTRYRKPRFNNRRKPEGWLAPSTRQKVFSHIKVIEDITKFLPISEVIIEVAQFDMQRIKNPGIAGTEYQQGPQMDFWNLREYVFFRDKHQCQCCHGKSKDRVLNVHHIESRKTGGNSPDNLVTLCETCHDAYHKGKIELKLKRSFQSLRDAAVMNVMRWEVLRQTEMALGVPVTHTIGYMTKYARIHAGLEKSHVNDALCIAGHPHAQRCENIYLQKKTARHIRQAQKANILSGGRRKANKLPYVVKGFRLFDKVRYGGQECFVFGRRISGYFDLRRLDGTRVHASAGYKKIRFLETSKGYITQMFNQSNKENAFPLTTEVASIHA